MLLTGSSKDNSRPIVKDIKILRPVMFTSPEEVRKFKKPKAYHVDERVDEVIPERKQEVSP